MERWGPHASMDMYGVFKTAKEHNMMLESYHMLKAANDFLVSQDKVEVKFEIVEEEIVKAEEMIFKQKMAEEITTNYKCSEVKIKNTPIKPKKVSAQLSPLHLDSCMTLKIHGKVPKNIFNARVDLTDTGGSQLNMTVKWLILGLPTPESIAGT